MKGQSVLVAWGTVHGCPALSSLAVPALSENNSQYGGSYSKDFIQNVSFTSPDYLTKWVKGWQTMVSHLFFFLNIYFYLFIWLHWVLSVACGIQFSDQGLNPGPLHWEFKSQSRNHQGSPSVTCFCKYKHIVLSVICSVVSDSVTPWSVACQAPLSMGFPRQEYWREFPFPSPGDLPDPGIEPRSPALQADSLPTEPPGKPILDYSQRHSLMYHLWLLLLYKDRGEQLWQKPYALKSLKYLLCCPLQKMWIDL